MNRQQQLSRLNQQQWVREIDSHLRLGGQRLRAKQSSEALDSYQRAYRLALRLADAKLIRACAFNLGACLVARGDYDKAVNYLQLVLPSERDEPPVPYVADVHFNLAVAHDRLGNAEAAQEAYRTAFLLYGGADKPQLQCEVALKIASDAESRGNNAEARSYYLAAMQACQGNQALTEWRLRCQVKYAAVSHRLGDDRPLEGLAECESAAHLVPGRAARVQLLNEIGITYMQANRYSAAAESFTSAMHSVGGVGGDDPSFQRAALLQNLAGALTALGRHREALAKYTETVRLFRSATTPSSQGLGHCYLNMALCYAHLKRVNSSAESYEMALQFAKEAGDKTTQWQALEGLGAVDFNSGHNQSATARFAEALALASDTEEARVRIAAKLQRAGGGGSRRSRGGSGRRHRWSSELPGGSRRSGSFLRGIDEDGGDSLLGGFGDGVEGEGADDSEEEPEEVREARRRLRQAVYGEPAYGLSTEKVSEETEKAYEAQTSERDSESEDEDEQNDNNDKELVVQNWFCKRVDGMMETRPLMSVGSIQNVANVLHGARQGIEHRPQSDVVLYEGRELRNSGGVDSTDSGRPRRVRRVDSKLSGKARLETAGSDEDDRIPVRERVLQQLQQPPQMQE
uniref:TPR_REGION domain-containing protein n=1 Tax=Macrostomum lignano TaxID=282301 RepID=A0A1I8HR10_9PLAT